MKLYSIGEVSKLNNISIKALRHYDKIGLLEPAHIDQNSGYRYYTHAQFIIIDKIKKFKYWDIPLSELKELIYSDDTTTLESFFEKQKVFLDSEAKRIEESKKMLDKLREHFLYFNIVKMNTNVYVRHIHERHYILSPTPENADVEETDIAFRKLLASPDYCNITIINPYGYLLDSESFLKEKINYHHSFVSIDKPPKTNAPHHFVAPNGIYVCYSSKILSTPSSIKPLIDYLEQNNLKPKLILAEEFIPYTIINYMECPYEIQILCDRK